MKRLLCKVNAENIFTIVQANSLNQVDMTYAICFLFLISFKNFDLLHILFIVRFIIIIRPFKKMVV